MALLSSLYSRLIVRLPKASTLLVAQELQDTLIDFLERTRAYQSELAPQDIVADQAEYTITPPASYVLIEAYEVRVNQRFVRPTSEDTLDLQWEELSRGYTYRMYHSHAYGGLDSQNWRYATATDPRFYYMSAKTGKLRLVGIPDTAYTGTDGLIFTGAWKPVPGVTQVDDAIFNDYYQTLVKGALARCYSIPDKPWTNPALAKKNQDEYAAEVASIENAIRRNQQRDNITVYRTVAYA